MAIGYACLAVDLPGSKISACVLRNASEDNIRRIIKSNLSALEVITHYNKLNHIKLFRISSDIIPFGSHPINQIKWWEEYKEELNQLGENIKKAGIRVSMHPGQYTVLNSPDLKVVQNAVKDLEYQERFLTMLGMDGRSKLVLHIGGVYKDKKRAIDTFLANYSMLSSDIKRRLVIENDDKNYNIEETLNIARILGIPAIFDNLHHKINPPRENKPDTDWIRLCATTWSEYDGKQKIHYSQQKEDAKPGSHSDTIFVDEFISFYKNLPDKEIDIMLEVKDKNISAVKCIHAVETGEH